MKKEYEILIRACELFRFVLHYRWYDMLNDVMGILKDETDTTVEEQNKIIWEYLSLVGDADDTAKTKKAIYEKEIANDTRLS